MRHTEADLSKQNLRNAEIEQLALEQKTKLDAERTVLRDNAAKKLAKIPSVSPLMTTIVSRIGEFLLLMSVGYGLTLFYPGVGPDLDRTAYLVLSALAALIFCVAAEFSGLYKLHKLLNPKRHLSQLTLCWLVTFAVVGGVIFFTKEGITFSRGWAFAWIVAGFFFMMSARFIGAGILKHYNSNGQFNRRTLLVGGGQNADEVVATLNDSPDSGVTIVGLFDDREDDRAPSTSSGVPKLGGFDEIVEFVREANVDTIIFTLPVNAEQRLLTILKKLWILPVDIRLSAHAQKLRYRPQAYSYLGNLPCIDVYDRPLSDWGLVLKALEDRIIAFFAIILLSPVMLAVAMAVKFTSKGPIIFKQKRYGFNNELINVYKFRSMYTDQSDARADKLVTKGDPRVTSVGRFIRKSSLDELPQLFNVLKGDLSLVGPRPHATQAKAAGSLYEQVVEDYFARHKVKPGITGWAQINGWRGETDTAEKIRARVEHDLHYIENWSLTFDLYILARTPISLLKTENAY